MVKESLPNTAESGTAVLFTGMDHEEELVDRYVL